MSTTYVRTLNDDFQKVDESYILKYEKSLQQFEDETFVQRNEDFFQKYEFINMHYEIASSDFNATSTFDYDTATAKEIGRIMRENNVSPPYPQRSSKDIFQSDSHSIYQIQGVDEKDAVVLEKNGFATLYVSPNCKNYREIYGKVMTKETLPSGKAYHVEHLCPKSQAENDSYVALGLLDAKTNLNHGNKGSVSDYVMKAMSIPFLKKEAEVSPSFYTMGGSTDSQKGWFAKNGYIKPTENINMDVLKKYNHKN